MTIEELDPAKGIQITSFKLKEPAIDWEQRRYEIAKDVMAALITEPDPCFVAGPALEFCAQSAVKAANLLIKELKSQTNKSE